MQNQKVHHQHPILNLETGGTVLVSSPPQVQPSPKTSLVFSAGLLFLGLLAGIAIGTFGAEKKVADARDSLKLEQLQRQAMQSKIDKFCSENGGQDGR